MCLALEGTVLKISGKNASVDFGGTVRDANAEFLRPNRGDRVMVFNDFIIEVVKD
jgi:hydrogenase maturation factor